MMTEERGCQTMHTLLIWSIFDFRSETTIQAANRHYSINSSLLNAFL